MKKYSYFDVPTQVQFWDYTYGHHRDGIAYRDEIICGCCGDVFRISEIYELAPDALLGDPIIVYDDWVAF